MFKMKGKYFLIMLRKYFNTAVLFQKEKKEMVDFMA